jgi:hypothetical protein
MNIRQILDSIGVESRQTSDIEVRDLGLHDEIPEFAVFYLRECLSSRPYFVSNVYLWSLNRLVSEIFTHGSLAYHLMKCGYLPFGSGLSGDLICACQLSGQVFWSARSIFIDGCDEIVFLEGSEEVVAYPSREGFEKALVYIGEFNEEFVLSIIEGRFAKLIEHLYKL